MYLDKDEDLVYYKWKKEIPFYKNGKVFLKQGDEILTLLPTTGFQSQKTTPAVPVNFIIEKSIYYAVEFKEPK